MYKTSVPIAIQSMREECLEQDLQKYLDYFHRGGIQRVFLALLPGSYTEAFDRDIHSEKLKRSISFFQKNGLEVGVWIGGFGHGSALAHDQSQGKRRDYQKLTGIRGEAMEHGYCPLDEHFTEDYLANVRSIAQLGPDLLMLDDDFRLNGRHYYFGCFCPLHLKELFRTLGEELSREELEQKVLSGGKNKYRDACLDLFQKTLLDFAKKVRCTLDSVNPQIRCGICLTPSGWDMEGTDGAELAKALAGNTVPFARPFGAPYHCQYDFVVPIEQERLQLHWMKMLDANVETFVEGDVYPRPRYNVTSKCLELYDLAMRCDGQSNGILKYMFDYDIRVGYETGYIENHIRNQELHQEIASLFQGKNPTGVSVFSVPHKIRNFRLPEHPEDTLANKLGAVSTFTASILSKNSIPTCYDSSEYPVMVCGESARYLPLDRLTNGAILDGEAARILTERGVDTGLENWNNEVTCYGEYFLEPEDTITNFADMRFAHLVCRDTAKISSVLLPSRSPGAYTYENADGIRFLVLAGNFQFCNGNANYFNSYYRQSQMLDGIAWVGRKKLPVVCPRNPNLYLMTARDGNTLSVLMINLFMDDVHAPDLILDQAYTQIRCIHCSGTLDGNVVHLSDLGPYDFAAFEVRLS